MKHLVRGRRVLPNQTAMEMTAPHVDDMGRIWPQGTVYQPSSAGMDGAWEYQEITIKGQYVRFTARPHGRTGHPDGVA